MASQMNQRLMKMTETPETIQANIVEIRETIFSEFRIAENENQRGALLGLFCSVLDIVESTVADPQLLESLKKSRESDYRSMLTEEALIYGNISIDILNSVTLREIAAGRMPPDHPLRGIAEMGMQAPHPSTVELIEMGQNRNPAKTGWLRSIADKIKAKLA
jgi:hypothetical protein